MDTSLTDLFDTRLSRLSLIDAAFLPVWNAYPQTGANGRTKMDIKKLFLDQLEREAAASRKAIERVPEGKGDWKPHEKSMELQRLAPLAATMLGWHVLTIERDELDLNDPSSVEMFRKPLTRRAEMLNALDEFTAASRQAISGATEEHLRKPWKLRMGETVLWEQPRYEVIADTFTHLAHHRGQLTVYLRLLGSSVPALYGPSADEA